MNSIFMKDFKLNFISKGCYNTREREEEKTKIKIKAGYLNFPDSRVCYGYIVILGTTCDINQREKREEKKEKE